MMRLIYPFFLALLFGIGMPAFAQSGVISSTLLEQMSGAGNNALRINVFLKQKANISELHKSFSDNQIPLNDRARITMQTLKQHASQTQEGLMELIKSWNQQNGFESSYLKANWMVNMIVLDAPVALIDLLSREETIEFIEWDQALLLEFYPPMKGEQAVEKSINGTEPGLLAIKAPYMWQMGYTGRNTRAYSVDTGIWENHPAIKENFLSTFFPYTVTWNAFDQTTPADKVSSHGTHTMGTVCGLDRATNDTIGVAFNARFVATDPIVSDVAFIKPLSVIMTAYEWALNPDGDESTTDDIPHVIVNSWGISGSFNPDLCVESYVHDLFNACNTAGIAIVFSAGNNGPSAQTISKPAYVVVNDVIPFTVGAFNAATQIIAQFSSRGPAPCDVAPELRIKPEVVAPGENIRSAVGQNEYDTYSGTSMAGPHVAGAFLLLREAFPEVHAEEILRALLHTAVDFGEEGEDNAYGMGLIDLQAAFDTLAMNHTVFIPDYSGYDLRIDDLRMTGANNKFVCSDVAEVQITVSNSGDFDFNGFSIIAKHENGNQIASEMIDEVLLPGQSWQGVINIPASQGFNEIQFHASLLIDIVETDRVNNHRMLRFRKAGNTTIPFFDAFETHAITDSDWILLNPDFSRTWDTLRTAGLNHGQYAARMDFRNYNPRSFQRDELITPFFTAGFTGTDSLYLKFNYAYRFIHQSLNDSLHIYLIRNCDAQRYPLLLMGNQSLGTVNQNINPFVPTQPEHWASHTINLTEFMQQNGISNTDQLMVAFTTLNRGGSAVFIDNVAIFRGNDDPTAIQVINNELSIDLFPNPIANENLTIRLSQELLQPLRIEVMDLTGRVEFTTHLPAKQLHHELSVNTLAKGIYILRLQAEGNNTVVRRFVKL